MALIPAIHKALYLNEIARMHTQFGNADIAIAYFKLATETSLANITNDEIINISTLQMYMLIANVFDLG